MMSKLDPYIIELESKIQILERENEVLSVKAEKNLLLNRAFDETNICEIVDNVFLDTLESISILLNIQFSGIFDFFENTFKCIASYSLFNDEDNVNIDFRISEFHLQKIESKQLLYLHNEDNNFFFKYSTSNFIADEVLLIPLNTESIKNRYFVFINDDTGIDMSVRIALFEKIIRIISAKLERIYYQNELEKLNEQLEQIVELRTLELNNQIKEYQALNEEYKKLNEELFISKVKAEESELQFKSLFENAADAIFIADQESGTIVHANLAAENLLLLPHSKIIGLNQANLHPKHTREFATSSFQMHQLETSKSRVTHFIENTIIRTDGTEVPVEILASEVIYKGKKCLMGTFRDITERKKSQIELIAAKEKAEESDRLKTAFLQNMSHEIRTPMNAIIGFSSIMKNTQLKDEKRNNYLDIIIRSGKHLMELINSIVDISKIDAGYFQAIKESTNINKLMKDIYDFFNLQLTELRKSNVRISYIIPNEEIFIHTDETRLRQILTNLINNAIKFTEKGYVEFGFDVFQNKVNFFVKDTGIGIPKEKLHVIFDRFIQATESTEKFYGGTGLGLAISKALTELLGGRIWVESTEGLGSTFYFTIDSCTNIISDLPITTKSKQE